MARWKDGDNYIAGIFTGFGACTVLTAYNDLYLAGGVIATAAGALLFIYINRKEAE